MAVRGTKVVWDNVTIITAAQFSITYLLPLKASFVRRCKDVIE